MENASNSAASHNNKENQEEREAFGDPMELL